MTALIEDFAAIRAARAELSAERSAIFVHALQPFAPGVYRLTAEDARRIEGYTFTAPSPQMSSAGILALVHAERRAEIAARIESSLAAAHFRVGE